ncbi:MAG: hypothetical protein EXR73_08845 [Myxococcales bacterium]|nr:hypothetical protein [Myxococcales bacterium]
MIDDHAEWEADFSDCYDDTLAPERKAALDAHLAACEHCRTEFDHFREAVGAVRLLDRRAAPTGFGATVTETIHRRSAGRFFGRRAFGDRIPFEALALVALIIAAVAVLLVRTSLSGSLVGPSRKAPPAIAPGAHDVMPRP